MDDVDVRLNQRECPDCGQTLHMRSDASGNSWMHVQEVNGREQLTVGCPPPVEPRKPKRGDIVLYTGKATSVALVVDVEGDALYLMVFPVEGAIGRVVTNTNIYSEQPAAGAWSWLEENR